jgi:hypothetical protein
MTHTFIVNSENVNEYGYRVLTDGIDTVQFMRNPVVLFMHDRFNEKNRGSEVVGRVVKLYIDKKQLIAEVEFDEADPFAKVICGKVERGFIRMASLYADVVETSMDPKMLLPGQAYETVTKCKMVELSIVDIGGNDDALKLSRDGKPLQLKKVNINKNENMSKLITIALALGMLAETPEDTVVGEVQKLKLAKDASDNKVIELQNQLKGIRASEATALVDKAVQLGLIPEAFKPSQILAFESDFDGQKAILTKVIGDKEAESGQSATHVAVKEVLLKGKTGKVDTDQEETFDYLQKHDTVKLGKIRDEQPEKYAELAKAYGKGVRYTPNK